MPNLIPRRFPDLLATPPGRRAAFALLYLSEGAPMGFIWWALPTLLTRQGVDLASITLITSTATLPWVFKFLVGPLVDASTQRRAGLRPWILGCQVMMGLALLPLAGLDWAAQTTWLLILLVAHAIAAATQDVAIDTLAMRSVPELELGPVNGWMQAGMLLGRAGVAGGALLLYDRLGQSALVFALIGIICVPMLLVALAIREPAPAHHSASSNSRDWLRALLALPMLIGLWITLTASAGFEFLGVAAGPLLTELGATSSNIALFFAVVAPAGLGLGALFGGWCGRRIGLRRTTLLAILVVGALSTGLGLALSRVSLDAAGWLAVIGTVYAAVGVLTAASYALFMRLARGRYAATRFSALMAGTNACEAWAAFAGGRLQAALGYGAALPMLAAASLLALPALLLVSPRGSADDEQA
jgi:PAT family beta-lactamase induction signal transducer AmpG